MKFEVGIELGNEAMEQYADIAGALRKIARRFDLESTEPINRAESGKIMDSNGNSVGYWEITH